MLNQTSKQDVQQNTDPLHSKYYSLARFRPNQTSSPVRTHKGSLKRDTQNVKTTKILNAYAKRIRHASSQQVIRAMKTAQTAARASLPKFTCQTTGNNEPAHVKRRGHTWPTPRTRLIRVVTHSVKCFVAFFLKTHRQEKPFQFIPIQTTPGSAHGSIGERMRPLSTKNGAMQQRRPMRPFKRPESRP